MRSDFNERRARRIQSYKDRAAKHEQLGEGKLDQARKFASFIPFGQPILIGHHSERRDRNFRERIHNTFGQGFKALEYAEHLKDKAKTAEANTSISSDDPEAITKLKEKLVSLEKNQQFMKEANKVIRSGATEAEKVDWLVSKGVSQNNALELLNPKRFGGKGFATFDLTNNNAEINRIKKRIESLEKLNTQETKEFEVKGVRVVDNVEDNRLQLFFEGKPKAEIILALKKNGFRWSPSVGAWQRYRGSNSNYAAKAVLEKV